MFAEKANDSEERSKDMHDEAQELLRKWEAGDEEIRKVWKQMNDWWYEGVKQTYEREGSHFDAVDYESQVYDKGRDLVLAGVTKGVFIKEEDGSVSVDLTEQKLDKKYLLRKDGTTIYITQDMYLWDVRNERYHPDLALVTTAAEQSYHFAVLAEVFKLLGYSWAPNFKHLPYEHVFLGKDKMSSRGGNTIAADDLLAMIKDRVREVMQGLEKNKAASSDEVLVEQIAFGAIKYGYLKYEPNTRIYFDPEQTIALEGNTGPYIQYAYARIKSILSKAGEFSTVETSNLHEPQEIELMRWLQYYQDKIVYDAASEYKPNLLCNYLYELASKFNAFYSAVPVLSGEESIKNERLTLLTATANILAHGLGLLGITAPEKM
jgi:arginyl-tRNA synthetase